MIVRDLGDGQLLCINQTTHAMQAVGFCRHWGGPGFMAPAPFEAVMAGIFLHDNGWFEWEQAPEVRPDGYPMDFVHGPAWEEKLELWRRGVWRAFAQHPYAGLLVMRHAAILYGKALPGLVGAEHTATAAFVAEQAQWAAKARRLLRDQHDWAGPLEDEAIEANTRLLQYGDMASLVLTMPWAADSMLGPVPTDPVGGFTDLRLCHGEGWVTVDPWPYAVPSFEVSVHGRVLSRHHFAGHEEYRSALAAAPLRELRWSVNPG